MKTVLITGGAGFLGSHLCDLFIQKGWRVLCLDNLLTGSLENISRLRRHKRFRFLRHNIAQPVYLKDRLDLILHFASPASPSDYLNYPIQTLKVGALGTHNCLGLAKAKGARFLLASTSEVYGDPHVHPQPEEYWGHVNPVGPRGVYDEAKRFAEAITMAYHRVHDLDTRIVRIFNTYGPRMRLNDGRAIPNFITQALRGEPITIYGSGRQTRSFCYVSDMIDGIYRLTQADYSDPMNIGNPAELSLNGLAAAILRIAKSSSPLRHASLPTDDPKRRRPDIGKARRLLKWRPRVTLDAGLRQTIRWFRSRLTDR